MKKKGVTGGFTLIEVLIGLTIFLGITIPLIRYLTMLTIATTIKDQKNAYAILRGECAVMYKNQKFPQPSRIISIDNRVYEITCVAEKESILVDWTMSVKKEGKAIAALHGLLYIPTVEEKNLQ